MVSKLAFYQKMIKKILENFHKEPDIHIVFKDEKKLKEFENKLLKTSRVSGLIVKKPKFKFLLMVIVGTRF